MVSNPDKGQDSRLSTIASICCAPVPLLRPSTKPKAQRTRDLGLCTAEGDRGKENAVTPGTEKPQCAEQETTSPQRVSGNPEEGLDCPEGETGLC